jgi:hypothetical protein
LRGPSLLHERLVHGPGRHVGLKQGRNPAQPSTTMCSPGLRSFAVRASKRIIHPFDVGRKSYAKSYA